MTGVFAIAGAAEPDKSEKKNRFAPFKRSWEIVRSPVSSKFLFETM